MVNKWKVTKNNPDKFIRLGNVFPTISDIENFFNQFPTELKNLLKQASRDYEEPFDMFIEYLSKSQEKTVSRLINLCIMEYGITPKDDYYVLSTRALKLLANTVNARYYNKWSKLYNTTIREYDYLKPYDMQIDEEGTNNMSATTGITQRGTESGENTKQIDLRDVNSNSYNGSTENETLTDKTTDGIYGFNSTSLVPTDESENTSKSTENTTNNSEDTLVRTGNETENNSVTINKNTDSTYDRENPYEKNIVRKGNIGNITLQELTEKEREVLEYQFWDTVFKDLDSTLVRSKYIIGGGLCQ